MNDKKGNYVCFLKHIKREEIIYHIGEEISWKKSFPWTPSEETCIKYVISFCGITTISYINLPYCTITTLMKTFVILAALKILIIIPLSSLNLVPWSPPDGQCRAQKQVQGKYSYNVWCKIPSRRGKKYKQFNSEDSSVKDERVLQYLSLKKGA